MSCQTFKICAQIPTLCLSLRWKVPAIFLNKKRIKQKYIWIENNHWIRVFLRCVALHTNKWFCAHELNTKSLQENACLQYMSKSLGHWYRSSGQNRLKISFLNYGFKYKRIIKQKSSKYCSMIYNKETLNVLFVSLSAEIRLKSNFSLLTSVKSSVQLTNIICLKNDLVNE